MTGADATGPLSTPLYRDYHDNEWGRPVRGRVALFERMMLEAFQSGLSWLVILRKRENFRRAFDGFDIETVAAYSGRDVDRLMGDEGIVRNRAKIEAAIANARCRGPRRRSVRPALVICSRAPGATRHLGRRARAHAGISPWPETSSGAAFGSWAPPPPTR